MEPEAWSCSVSGLVVDGSKALSLCAAVESVPDLEYSVASVLMFSLSCELLGATERRAD